MYRDKAPVNGWDYIRHQVNCPWLSLVCRKQEMWASGKNWVTLTRAECRWLDDGIRPSPKQQAWWGVPGKLWLVKGIQARTTGEPALGSQVPHTRWQMWGAKMPAIIGWVQRPCGVHASNTSQLFWQHEGGHHDVREVVLMLWLIGVCDVG